MYFKDAKSGLRKFNDSEAMQAAQEENKKDKNQNYTYRERFRKTRPKDR